MGFFPANPLSCLVCAAARLTSPSVGSPLFFLRFFFFLPSAASEDRFFFFSALAWAASASAARPDWSSARSLAMKLEYSEALLRRNSSWFVCVMKQLKLSENGWSDNSVKYLHLPSDGGGIYGAVLQLSDRNDLNNVKAKHMTTTCQITWPLKYLFSILPSTLAAKECKTSSPIKLDFYISALLFDQLRITASRTRLHILSIIIAASNLS